MHDFSIQNDRTGQIYEDETEGGIDHNQICRLMHHLGWLPTDLITFWDQDVYGVITLEDGEWNRMTLSQNAGESKFFRRILDSLKEKQKENKSPRPSVDAAEDQEFHVRVGTGDQDTECHIPKWTSEGKCESCGFVCDGSKVRKILSDEETRRLTSTMNTNEMMAYFESERIEDAKHGIA